MTSRTRCLSLLVVLSACGGGSGGDTGTSTGPGSSSSGGPAGSSGPTTGATGSEGSGTSSPTTSGGITGGATSSTSTSSGPGTTSEPLTTGTTGSSTTGSSTTGSSTDASSSSGGSGLACVDVSGDYGACAAIIGYGFDGTSCRAFSGCDCAPNCDNFSPDPISCAMDCAAAGECNPSALHPAGINKDPVVKGSVCDELDACIVDPEHVAWLMKIFGKVECEPANYPCDQGQNCHVLWQGMLGEAQWPQVCAASLLPGADLQCVIWGP